jgi:hypothetical protein
MSYLFMIIGWGLVGWCGTGRRPRPQPKPPGPNPFIPIIFGIIGGIIGGLLYHLAFPADVPLTGGGFALTCIGAFVGGFILSDLADLFKIGWKKA